MLLQRPPCPHPKNCWSLRGAVLCLEAKAEAGTAGAEGAMQLAALQAELDGLPGGGAKVQSSCLCSKVHTTPGAYANQL